MKYVLELEGDYGPIGSESFYWNGTKWQPGFSAFGAKKDDIVRYSDIETAEQALIEILLLLPLPPNEYVRVIQEDQISWIDWKY